MAPSYNRSPSGIAQTKFPSDFQSKSSDETVQSQPTIEINRPIRQLGSSIGGKLWGTSHRAIGFPHRNGFQSPKLGPPQISKWFKLADFLHKQATKQVMLGKIKKKNLYKEEMKDKRRRRRGSELV